jgi:hypothetical protein
VDLFQTKRAQPGIDKRNGNLIERGTAGGVRQLFVLWKTTLAWKKMFVFGGVRKISFGV